MKKRGNFLFVDKQERHPTSRMPSYFLRAFRNILRKEWLQTKQEIDAQHLLPVYLAGLDKLTQPNLRLAVS